MRAILIILICLLCQLALGQTPLEERLRNYTTPPPPIDTLKIIVEKGRALMAEFIKRGEADSAYQTMQLLDKMAERYRGNQYRAATYPYEETVLLLWMGRYRKAASLLSGYWTRSAYPPDQLSTACYLLFNDSLSAIRKRYPGTREVLDAPTDAFMQIFFEHYSASELSHKGGRRVSLLSQSFLKKYPNSEYAATVEERYEPYFPHEAFGVLVGVNVMNTLGHPVARKLTPAAGGEFRFTVPNRGQTIFQLGMVFSFGNMQDSVVRNLGQRAWPKYQRVGLYGAYLGVEHYKRLTYRIRVGLGADIGVAGLEPNVSTEKSEAEEDRWKSLNSLAFRIRPFLDIALRGPGYARPRRRFMCGNGGNQISTPYMRLEPQFGIHFMQTEAAGHRQSGYFAGLLLAVGI